MKRIWLLAGLMLAGCARVDTGQADYRIAEPPGAMTERNMSVLKGNHCDQDLTKSCDPLMPSRVVRRYMPDPAKGWDAFKDKQVYSIEIEQGMIGSNILEGEVLGHQFGKTAEIAILANIFEFASQEGDAKAKRFLEGAELPGAGDDPSDVELKLVYFSDDVQRHQALSFSNISLRPRVAYAGGSIGIQIVVMEVDAQAGPVASLLKTLAKLGQQALPGPGEAKDMLYDLGESLLTGSQDDKLLEYRFVLSATTEDARAVQATFAPGRYVIRRTQNRAEDMKWDALRLDHNTGRLFKEGAGGKFDELREDLYLVLNVRRYPDGTRPEFVGQKNWGEFREALQTAADAKAGPLDKVTSHISNLLVRERSDSLLDGLRGKWAIAQNRLTLYSSRYADDFKKVDVATCEVSQDELARRLDIAQREVADAIRVFRAEYQSALALKRKDDQGNVVGELEVADREKIASTVASYFMPWSLTGADQASFASAADFEKNYMATAATKDLLTESIKAAKANAPGPATCNGLIVR